MPSHKIHLKIAQDVNKKLKLDNDSIMLGSVLPDLTINRRHALSHFQDVNGELYYIARPELFLEKYKDTLNNPISIGYLIHLLTDRYYSYNFYQKYFNFKDNKPEKLKHKYSYINNVKKFKRKLYYQYDEYLLKHGLVEKFKNSDIIDLIPKYQELAFDKQFLKEYIQETNDEIDYYFTEIDKTYKIKDQKYFDNLYNGCLEYILKYFNTKINKDIF